MRRNRFLFVAIASAAVLTAHAARPRYGGMIRIEAQGTIRSLDPAAAAADTAEASLREIVLPLVFETLVARDPEGRIRPALATSWESDAAGVRWRFALRSGVTMHDGTALDAGRAAAALGLRAKAWQVVADGSNIVIDTGAQRPDLLWELADIRTALAFPSPEGGLVGTGPFRAERMDRGELVVRAHEDYWNGRPFLDAVRVAFARAPAEQLASLESGRADLVSIRALDVRRGVTGNLRTEASLPLELFALVFEPHRAAPVDLVVRTTLAAAVDRPTIARVLLQGHGAPADALLPSWLSGYPPYVLAPFEPPLPAARVAALPPQRRSLTLRVTAGDAVAQAIADRIAVDARRAGFTMAVQAPTGLAARADLRLVRISLPATSPDRALTAVMTALGPRTLATATREAAPAPSAPLDAVARAERAVLEQRVVVPIVHVPLLYGVGGRVESVAGRIVFPSGGWDLTNVWMASDSGGQR